MLRSILAAACLAAALPAAAQTPAEQALIDRAIARGALIYAYDQAAWHGTDDMLVKVKEPEKVLGGWIIDGPAEAAEAIFYDKSGTQAVYVANFRNNKLVSSRVLGADEDRALTPRRRAMVAARNAALDQAFADKPGMCSKGLNTVVLPPEREGGPVLVYVMSPQPANREYPLGGHYLYEVTDGKASKPRPFMKSCMTMKVPPKAAAFTVTHLLDPVPTEIHVFTALTSGLPLVVVTEPGRLWSVQREQGGAAVRFLRTIK